APAQPDPRPPGKGRKHSASVGSGRRLDGLSDQGFHAFRPRLAGIRSLCQKDRGHCRSHWCRQRSPRRRNPCHRCHLRPVARRYAGTSHIDAADTLPTQAKDIAAELAGKGLTISGLGFYPNPLHPDQAHREAVIDHLKKVIVLASRMGVPLVNTFCGGDASKTVDANWETAQKAWPAIIAHAREHGVKLAFENCPMIF